MPSRSLPSERDAFLVPADVAYFNTASLSPRLRAVDAAGRVALERTAQPWTIATADWFNDVERLRGLYARLINGDADGVAIIPATSYGQAIAAVNLEARPGQTVVLIAEDYPSTVYAWRAFSRRSGAAIVTVARGAEATWTEAVLAAIDERTAVVAVPNVAWTNAALLDLPRIGAAARAAGAALVVDATQSIGALPFDVARVRPDYVVNAGYKWLLGPFGVSYLYVAPERRGGQPIENNWIARAGSDNFAGLVEYVDEYAPGARRFDVGQRTHLNLVPLAIAALEQILAWGVDNVAARLGAVTARIEAGARERGIVSCSSPERGPHFLGLAIPAEVRVRVEAELARARVYAAMRSTSLRVSPHLHVDDGDVDRLLDALARALGR